MTVPNPYNKKYDTGNFVIDLTFGQDITFNTQANMGQPVPLIPEDLKYAMLPDKPSIEDVILQGNKTFKQLGMESLSVQEIEQILYFD